MFGLGLDCEGRGVIFYYKDGRVEGILLVITWVDKYVVELETAR